MKRLMPATLFGRTVLILALCLVLSQAASLLVNFFDRGSSMYQINADQLAQRIGRAASLLNRLPKEERNAVAVDLGGRDFRIEFAQRPIEIEHGYDELDDYEQNFAAAIRDNMNPPLLTTVEITRAARARSPDEVEAPSANRFEQWLSRRFYFLLPAAFSVVSQIELEDGSTAAFFVRMPQEPLSQLEALLPRLLMWMAIIFALSLVIARMMTSPLRQLDRAVTNIGNNPTGSSPNSVAIPESGPIELRRVIGSFNETQERIRRYMIERSSLLAAISHDLRTPITRMRLRAEMLPEAQRAKFIHDLQEMEELVGSSLDLFAELGKTTERRPVDVTALLESIANDWTDTGHLVTLEGSARAVYPTEPSMLRRCINNLVSNGIRYGGRCHIELSDSLTMLRISIRDHGPGMDEADLERVFEPFVRLEPSRNRDSGGTGIGLAISRNIARWHGGDVRLRNAPGRTGLIAEISLPRLRAPPPAPARGRRGEPAATEPATRSATGTAPAAVSTPTSAAAAGTSAAAGALAAAGTSAAAGISAAIGTSAAAAGGTSAAPAAAATAASVAGPAEGAAGRIAGSGLAARRIAAARAARGREAVPPVPFTGEGPGRR
ncbi:MAG: sensor histidine kinase [Lautropia sp.]